jgi:hypothetical protein
MSLSFLVGTEVLVAHFGAFFQTCALVVSLDTVALSLVVYLVHVKLSGRLFQIFVAFSECPNFMCMYLLGSFFPERQDGNTDIVAQIVV